ncbi:MAG: ABC transporter permease subunit [Desulfocapsa sp.]|nr:ABC transporter permease subunit [Desulfocapsa sp.]MBN4045883.1 ABC transporter permease subunit [bacterium AH-315-P11]
MGVMVCIPKSNRLQVTTGAFILLAIALLSLIGPYVTPDPFSQNLSSVFATPSSTYLLGSDHLGRSVAARLIHGGANSLCNASLCVAGMVFLGVFLGLCSGWYGGLIDAAIMRLVDITMSFPGILLALLIAGLIGGGQMAVVGALIVTGWPDYCRITRAITQSIISRPYVEAGVLAGFSGPFILRKYIIIEIVPQIAVLATLGFGRTILNISSLGFIGIGLDPPEPEWGAMIAESLPYIRQAPHLILAPAAAVSITVFSFMLVGQPLAQSVKK